MGTNPVFLALSIPMPAPPGVACEEKGTHEYPFLMGVQGVWHGRKGLECHHCSLMPGLNLSTRGCSD